MKERLSKAIARQNKRKAQGYFQDKHHINPLARSNDNSSSNVVLIDAMHHEMYHWLFADMTPDEIINYLVDYFWKGEVGWLYKAIAKRPIDGQKLIEWKGGKK